MSTFLWRSGAKGRNRQGEKRYKIKDTLLLLYIYIDIDIYTTESAHPTLAKGCGVEAGVATLYKSKYRLDSDPF